MREFYKNLNSNYFPLSLSSSSIPQKSKLKIVDNVLQIWFMQQGENKMLVRGFFLKEKSLSLHQMIDKLIYVYGIY